MKNKELSKRVKDLRNRKGLSQEELAENTGLSLRTIQRIENGETEPRGDSLKRLAMAFSVSPDEIVDWTVQEDTGFLTSLNLSALSFILFPLLGIIVPMIIWVAKKDKIKDANKVAKNILNFQITWTMILFIGFLLVIISLAYKMNIESNISASMFAPSWIMNLFFLGVMYSYNLIMVIINTFRIANGKDVKYFPKIRFINNK